MSKIKNLKVYKGMLIVVDMVNGFVREGVLHDEKIADIIPRQIELIEEAKKKGYLIVFIKDTHDKNATEFKRFGNTNHCLKGSSESQLVDELKQYENNDDTIVIEKNSTSFMEAPKFREVAYEAENIEVVEAVGCCTDICVVNGMIGYANFCDQHNRNVEFKVHTDAIATYAEANRQNYVEAAQLLMAQQGIQLVKKR